MSTVPPSEVIRTFHVSGLHGEQFQHTRDAYAVAVYKKKNRRKPIVHTETNDWGSHAEKEMISHLEDVLESEALLSQTIQLYVNFSPCHNCSGLITQFLERAEEYYGIDLRLEIIVAHLYKIRRPSCVDGSHPRPHRLPEKREHNRNLIGLQMLSNWAEATLRPFAERDWQKLRMVLGCHFSASDYRMSGRREEDASLLEDFQCLCL